MPAGVMQFVGGSLQDFFNTLDGQDTVAFTGNAATGSMLRKHEAVVHHNVPFNVEADSLNTAALGGDLDSDDEAYQLFLKTYKQKSPKKRVKNVLRFAVSSFLKTKLTKFRKT